MSTLNVVLHAWSVRDAPTFPPLGSADIHVWQIDLDDARHPLHLLDSLLDADERARCARLRTDSLCRHFIARHGILRRLLGQYIGVSPEDVCYAYGEQGKPVLAAHQAGAGIFFNVSDSHDHALFAFTRSGEVGVDLELAVPFDDMPDVARDYFSLNEQAQLAALPAAEHTDGFYTCWTRKEAIIKCVGSGLSLPLDSFTVSLAPGSPAAIFDAEDRRIQALILREIPLPVPFVAACAVAPPPRLHSSLRLP